MLDLGLKPDTADMCIDLYNEDEPFAILNKIDYSKQIEFVPAWSLHRLIDLCGAERMPISFYKKGKVMIRVNHIHPTHNGRSNYNHYDSLIDCIEWLISEGYFNKEYLKQ